MSHFARKPTPRDWGIGAAVLLLCGIGLSWCVDMVNKLPEVREVCRPIVSVGACDRDGWCGVVIEGGDYIIAHYPTVGQTICRIEAALVAAKERR